jgi:hypothetical protein
MTTSYSFNELLHIQTSRPHLKSGPQIGGRPGGGGSLTKTAIESLDGRQSADDACCMSFGLVSSAIEYTNQPGHSGASGASLSSANDQIRQDKQQLDDWTTCVSAKTTKGQAEIQRLSAALSAAEDRAHRLVALQPQASPAAPTRSIDVWA